MKNELYTDVSLNFSRHPLTGDISKISGKRAINQSIENLILYNKFEKPHAGYLDSGIKSLLFSSNGTAAIAVSISNRVQFIIEQYEPRVEFIGVTTKYNDFTFNISIIVRILNEAEQFEVKIFLPAR